MLQRRSCSCAGRARAGHSYDEHQIRSKRPRLSEAWSEVPFSFFKIKKTETTATQQGTLVLSKFVPPKKSPRPENRLEKCVSRFSTICTKNHVLN
jgi:hypothetical protein